jgi:hypothetical protein
MKYQRGNQLVIRERPTMKTQTFDPNTRREALIEKFVEAITEFEKGAYSSRGLAKRVEQLTSIDEINQLDDALLAHSFWVARHLIHRPACWAPSIKELEYVYSCLRNEDQFSQEFVDKYRQ